MKNIEKSTILKICWKESDGANEKCAIGFLVKETETHTHLASTKNIEGFTDINEIKNDTIIKSSKLGIET